MSVSYKTTLLIFKKHRLGYVAIALWDLVSIIDIFDMLICLAS